MIKKEGIIYYRTSDMDTPPQSVQYEIVKKTIRKIEVSKSEGKGNYHLTFRSTIGDTYEFDYKLFNENTIRFFMNKLDMTDIIESLSVPRRYQRKKYTN